MLHSGQRCGLKQARPACCSSTTTRVTHAASISQKMSMGSIVKPIAMVLPFRVEAAMASVQRARPRGTVRKRHALNRSAGMTKASNASSQHH